MAKGKPGSRTKGSRKVQQRLANLLVETDDSIKARDLGIKNADELEVRGTGKSKKPWTVKNGVYDLKIDNRANRKKLKDHLSALIKNNNGSTDAIKGITIAGSPKRIGALEKFNDGKVDTIEFRNIELATPSIMGKTAKQVRDYKTKSLRGPAIRWLRRLDNIEKWRGELNSGKIDRAEFDSRMRAMYKSAKLGTYDPVKFDKSAVANGWPEGTSRKDFLKWQNKSYSDAQDIASKSTKRTKIPKHAGHGWPAKLFGPNAPSNLGLQVAFGEEGNISQGGTAGQTKHALRTAEVATDTTDALGEYFFEKSSNIQRPGRHTSQTRGKLLHSGADPTGVLIGADRAADEKALQLAIQRANNPRVAPPEPKGGIMGVIKKGRKGALRQKDIKSSVANAINLRSLKLSGGLRKGDAYARLGIAGATGDVIGGTMAAGQIAMMEALQNSATQKAIAKQLGSSQTLQKLLAKRAAKTTAKLIPGVDIGISAGETWGYLSQGKLDQAGIAALSGAIGWVPLIGDAASATLDLANTGIDIARLDPSSLINNQKTKATQPDLNIGSKRFKFNPADKLSFKSLKGF